MVTTTTQYSFQKPTVGDDEDAWGGYLNSNFDSIDSLLRGATSLSSLNLTGTLAADDISISSGLGLLGIEFTDNLYIGGNSSHVKIGFGTDVVYPSNGNGTNANNTIDIGTSGNRFKDLYLAGDANVTGNITVGGNVDGRDIAADGTKLDGIESGATADQTKADIDALNIDAATLDSLDSTQFLRSDADDTTTGQLTVDNDNGIKVVSGTETANVYYTGYGIDSARTSTYIRPQADNTQTLYIGNWNNSLDWNAIAMKVGNDDNVTINDNKVFHAGNDGSGSGLDADTVDGYQTDTSYGANTVAVRTSSGHLYMNYGISAYLNMWHTTYQRDADTIFYSSGDNYLRKNNATGFKNSLGLGTGDSPTFSGLSVASNTDNSAEIGRAHVGYMGWSDWAGFSHVDANGQYSYALLQNPSGQTIVNAASGQSVSVNIANSNVAQWTSSWCSLQKPMYNYSIYYEDYDALSGTSVTVNCDTAQAFSLTMTDNTTFTFNSVANAWSYGFVLELTGHSTTAYTVTWPSSVEWAGGTAPDAPATGETDIYVFWTRDGGTTWYGVLSVDAAA